MTEMNRMEMLQDFLTQNPNDSFARYGLAMELVNSGQTEKALAEFQRLIEINPDYTAAYQMAAQTLLKENRVDEGRAMLEQGIASAGRTGNAHARSEMEGMLMTLPD
jgi:predicted Zn-dependent protease